MRVGRAPIRARPALFYFPPAHPSDCRTTPPHSALSPKLKRWIRWVSDSLPQPAFRFLCGRAPSLLSRERTFGLCLCCARSTHFWMMRLSLLAARTPIRSPGVMPHSSRPAIPPCSLLGWRGAARLCFWHRGFPAPIHPVSFIVFPFRPLHWARLRGNSCARRLRVFCFSGSSQKIFGNAAEDFPCPSRNADPLLGSRPLSLPSAPITRAENGETNAMYLNKIELIGYLGKSPEHKTTKNTGRTYAVLSLATQSAWKDANEEWQRRVEWHRLVAWNGLGEYAASKLKKGDHLW